MNKKDEKVNYEKLYDDLRDMLEKLILEFNFYKVKLAMDSLGWTWAGKTKSPTVYEMEELVKDLFERAFDFLEESSSTRISSSSGGFKVTLSTYDYISIEFVVEEWCSSYLED